MCLQSDMHLKDFCNLMPFPWKKESFKKKNNEAINTCSFHISEVISAAQGWSPFKVNI